MIERNTVLVLGAGASAPYGLPVGWKLRELILSMPEHELDRVPTDAGAATIHPGRGGRFITAFRRSQFESIDAFLARRPEFSDVGKHAIASCLLPLERLAHLLDHDPDDHWYRYLIRAMDAPWEELAENKLSVITFNYDRSLELILEQAWANQHNKTAEEARAVVAKIPIIHVYGSLGSLNPQAENFVPYGGGERPNDYLFRAAAGLRVIPEGRAESAEFVRAQSLLRKADCLCILGFAFDKTNVERLGGVEIGAGGRTRDFGSPTAVPFAATALGLKEAECVRAVSRISMQHFAGTALKSFHHMPCLEMLRHTLILGD